VPTATLGERLAGRASKRKYGQDCE